ncbi:MAG: flagellar hook-associated protein FlgK [Terriglobia bacterium]
MGTLFGGFEIGRKSLNAQQLALQVTSNNIANINTPGYSRQTAVLEDGNPIQTKIGQVGTGVEVRNIESVRDRFLELRVAQETQKNSQQQAASDSLSQIESVLGIGNNGLQDAVSNFFNSFSTLANNPESIPLRNNVLSSAQNLTDVFHEYSTQLSDIQQNVNASIKDAVTQINSLASRIADLNGQIVSAEATGAEAATSRDQRNELLRQLAELVDAHSYEAEDGSLSVTIAGGQPLVTAGFVQPLAASSTPPLGLFQIKSGANDITSKISGGKLAGWLQVRDQLIPGYLSDLDTLAGNLINQVNTLHQAGTDLQNPPTVPGNNFFAPITSVSGAARTIAVDPSIMADLKNIAAGQSGAPGDNANALAIANLANLKLMAGGTATFAEAFASLQTTVGTDAQSAKQQLDTYQAVLTQLQNQRDSVSGVSLDEEAINLLRFQRAYQASSKFISVIDQMTQDLMQIVS